jgi:calbindin D28
MAEGKPNFLSKYLGSKRLHSIEFITIWTHYDRDGSGYLERRELDNFIIDLIQQKAPQASVTTEMLTEVRNNVLDALDVNKDGRIELGEFARLLPLEDNFMKKFESRKTLSRKDFNDIFYHYDPDGNGYIEGKELMALIHDIMNKGSKKVSLKEVQDYRDAAMCVFDKNTDGRLSRKELGLLLSVDK